jgi:hypothetical protein
MMPLPSACAKITPSIVKSVSRKNKATTSSSTKKPTESSSSIKPCSSLRKIESNHFFKSNKYQQVQLVNTQSHI